MKVLPASEGWLCSPGSACCFVCLQPRRGVSETRVHYDICKEDRLKLLMGFGAVMLNA